MAIGPSSGPVIHQTASAASNHQQRFGRKLSDPPISVDPPESGSVTGFTAHASRWFREASGSVGDLGIMLPIAIAMVVVNGLSPTAVLLPAALLYLIVAVTYRLPVAVQPLKAFGAIAIAVGAGPDSIAAGSILMGATFLALGCWGKLDWVASHFPLPIVRGIQLSVGLLLAKTAWGLISNPPTTFSHQLKTPTLMAAGIMAFAVLLLFRQYVVLALIFIGLIIAATYTSGIAEFGPAPITFPRLNLADTITAATLLVIPQIPLTLANSCLAPADAARRYFGTTAKNITPSRLARTLGLADIFAGSISGMPVCHGAGGLSAHVAFGARTWRAPAIIGSALLLCAVAFGSDLVRLLQAFPLPILAGLLAVAAYSHLLLSRDLRGAKQWSIAIGISLLALIWNLAGAVLIGLAASAMLRRSRPAAHDDSGYFR